uniref:Centrosomal protein of 44 kDa n=2 Tax=Monopterus albus TaxID=43700 RepID=A0A3Q3J8Z5_MONAL
MVSTGDVQGCLRKLETLLRVIKYPGCVDYNGLSKGDPSAFLPIVSFTLTSFSSPFAEQLMAAGLELSGKTDLRFTDVLYKVLRDIFQYKPVLTKQQFLQWGFAQRKISVICDIINLVLQKHNQLKKPRVRRVTLHQDERGETHPILSDADSVSERLNDVNCIETPSTFPTNSSNNEVYSSSSLENGTMELTGRNEDKDNLLHWSEVEGRLSALEAQVQGLASGLDRLSSTLEKCVVELARRRNTDKNEDKAITICRESWENVMSRILLLETKLSLSNTQSSVPPPCPSSTLSHSSCSMPDASKEDLKGRLESITNM